MHRSLRAVYVSISWLLLLNIQVASAQNPESSDARSFSRFLEAGHIGRVSIIHLPSDIVTRTRVTPEVLRQLSPVEVSLRNAKESGLVSTLAVASKELSSAKHAGEQEVRWGILVFDAAGSERFAVFLDRTGQFVQIGDDQLAVEGKMFAWIQSSIRRLLK